MRVSAMLVAMALALLPCTATPATTALPQLEFVREYIRELGELERLRGRVEELTREPGADHMTEMIGYSTRVQIAMRGYIGRLNSIRLGPPHDALVTHIVSLHNSRYRLHGRIAEISTAMLAGPRPGVDLDALAAEMPQLRTVLDEVDAVFPDMSVLAFTTLVSPAADASGASTTLRINAAERAALLGNLAEEFGSRLDAARPGPLTLAAVVLRGYLQKDFTPAE